MAMRKAVVPVQIVIGLYADVEIEAAGEIAAIDKAQAKAKKLAKLAVEEIKKIKGLKITRSDKADAWAIGEPVKPDDPEKSAFED